MAPRRRRRDPVDVVALTLAAALGATSLLILLATMVQILNKSFPQVSLSENATQVLIASTGGLTGLLGAYIGVRAARKHSERDEEQDDEGGG